MSQDKVNQLRDMLKGKHEKKPPVESSPDEESTTSAEQSEADTESPSAGENEKLALEIDKLKTELKSQKDVALRQIAEAENRLQRITREHQEQSKFVNEKLLREIFPVLDNLEMTLTHGKEGDPLVEGVRLVHKQFLGILQKHGLTEVGAVGETFDPNFHEAIATAADTEGRKNVVVNVHRKGYVLHERLIRPAMVTVSES